MEKNAIFDNIIARTSVRSYTSKTIGAVWTALYPLQDRYQGMQQLLNLPAHLIPLNTLIIGYPKEEVKAKDKWKEENVTRI